MALLLKCRLAWLMGKFHLLVSFLASVMQQTEVPQLEVAVVWLIVLSRPTAPVK